MSQEKTKLSRADRKQIEAAIAKAKNTDKRHKSAQDSIPFQRMFPDGICRVTDYYYSKTVQFQDINYQLNQNEDKTAIFDSWCDFLNYFDSSIHFQLSFVNLAANKDSYAQTIAIPPRADAFNQLRTEYTKMLQTQLARGNNGLVKTKFITFGVEAENLKTAKPRLERIEIDILNNFKRLGVQAEPLNGHDRLKLMHDVLHMDEQEPFRFSWDWLAPSGLSVKDFIAPSSFEFRTGSSFAVGKKYGRASFLQILAPELNDRMLADFLDMESSVIVSMHIQSVDQVKAIKTIKRKITDLDKMKIEEQKKAIRAGYDMDIIPSDLATYGNEAKKLLQELQSRNERMFLLTFIILNTAGSMQQLKNNVFQANSIAQKYNCQFSVLYHRTLNVGRVVSPTLALIVQREAEIDAFKPEPFYTVTLGLPGFDAGSERMKNKPEAESLQKACGSQMAVVKAVERKDKAEKPPALYDLTTLQRDANRILGFTAQQTLDYLQLLYEKKLCTYPRTDSQYLTSDMADGLPALVSNVAATMPKVGGITIHVNAAQVINDKKGSDHHAVIPTANLNENALAGLPAGERAVLELVALRLLCAVSQPHEYTETAVTLECAGHSFSAKGRTVMNPGWRALMEAHYSGKGENETSDAAKALPPVDEGQTFTVHSAAVKEGKTTPPKHYTEDTLLSAMEVAGAKEMPEDAERKGLGTPATRAAILEKLVATGFVERKKSKKTVSLIPTHAGISLITVLPEQLQSPLMTAEWEHRLKEIERGEEAPETFMQGIRDMVCELVKTYKTVLGADVLFPSGRAVVGKCPRCGSDVTESKKGYFCERNDCHFGLWRDNRFLAAKKINLTKKMAETLLKDGKTYASGIFSEKTGKTYDAYIALEDDGTKTAYRLEFERGKANGKQYL